MTDRLIDDDGLLTTEDLPETAEVDPSVVKIDPPVDLSPEDAQNSVEAKVIQVPGIIIDTFTGKTWPVPTDDMEDNLRFHDSPYDIKKDPMFHYEAHGISEVADMESQGFVKVTNKELGRETYKLPGEVATPLDSYYTIGGDQVMMKIPKIYADRRYARLKKMCDLALSGTEPPPEVTEGRNEAGKSANARVKEDKFAELEVERVTTRDLQEAIRR